jgi:hypothetical protein
MNTNSKNSRSEDRPEVVAAEDGVLAGAPAIELPPTLSKAMAAAEAVLGRFDQFHKVLVTTHAAIPGGLVSERELSAELGAAEVTGNGADQLRSRLRAVSTERESHARQRAAATSAVVALEPELSKARAEVATAEASFALSIAGQFLTRWRQTLAELAILKAEGEALAAALRTRIDLRLELVAPSGATPPVTLPPSVSMVTVVLDRLDGALARCGAIRQAKEADLRHYRLAANRGLVGQQVGVYRVLQKFLCSEDGLPFEPGTLIDRTLMTDGGLYRCQLARHVRLASLDTPAGAAA